jgi:hypothetical protein
MDFFKNGMDKLNDITFEQFRANIKTGMLLRIVKSDFFAKMESELGRSKAMQNVSDLVNLHAGGQNLEAIGRSKQMQTMLQSALLAPDWTEAKIKRLVGAGMAKDPEVRKKLAASVITEFAMVIAAKWIGQSIYNHYADKDPTYNLTMQDWKDGIKHRRMGMIRIGDTEGFEKKAKFMQFFGSEEQDLATLSKTFDMAESMVEAYHQKSGIPVAQAGMGMFKEAGNRSAPIIGQGIHFLNSGGRGGETLEVPFLPIPVAEVSAAAQGKFGGETVGERTAIGAQALASSLLGVPEHVYDLKGQKKADKTKDKAAEKREREAKRKVRILE